MKFTIGIMVLLSSSLFFACEGDCKDEVIEKVTWVTYNTEYTQDTLVNYAIVEAKREYLNATNELLHSITLRNENETYSNKFAVQFKYGFVDTISNTKEMRFFTTDSVEILPKSSHTYTFNCQGKFIYNFNDSITLIQIPKTITLTRKADSLQIENYLENNCKVNIEAIKQKYKSIKELYYSKVETEYGKLSIKK